MTAGRNRYNSRLLSESGQQQQNSQNGDCNGQYDGFEYSDTKEIQDIPAEGKGNTAIYIAVAAVAVLAVAGGAFLFIRSRR